jgi:hypothetical protein
MPKPPPVEHVLQRVESLKDRAGNPHTTMPVDSADLLEVIESLALIVRDLVAEKKGGKRS